MTIHRAWLTASLVLIFLQISPAQQRPGDLRFGFVRGTVVFASPEPLGIAADAPATVLSFARRDGHRSLVLADDIGDYVAVLEPGNYCIAAYTKDGKHLEFNRNRSMCVDVTTGEYTRQDVVLVRSN